MSLGNKIIIIIFYKNVFMSQTQLSFYILDNRKQIEIVLTVTINEILPCCYVINYENLF